MVDNPMAYDEALAQRTRAALGAIPGLVERKMFGGVGFMVQGNMACGVHNDRLIVRVGPEHYDDALARPDTTPFDMTGRPMKGWVFVTAEGIQSDEDLATWVHRGVDFALSLPPSDRTSAKVRPRSSWASQRCVPGRWLRQTKPNS
jgi:TfoX/Sxy family transcriptional regulator of competence genes